MTTATSPMLGDLAASDRFARLLGVELVDAAPGLATVAMTVQADHLNFLGAGHGGAIFALADMAFGLASNSHGVTAVGVDAHVAYTTSVREGDRLVARASEMSRRRRFAVYRVDVHKEDGTLVSTFTGTVFVTGEPLPERA